MHANADLAHTLELRARMDDRTPSQIASAALGFYLRLPPEAHAALRHVQALGTDDDARRVINQVARLLLNAQYDVAVRRLGQELEERAVSVPESEEEMLGLAERLVAKMHPAPTDMEDQRSQTRKAG